MPIVSRIGRKSLSTRMVMAGIYLMLIGGGATMLYPFLLMLSTSVTSETDSREYRLIPRYWFDPEARYAKFIAEKYQLTAEYNDVHAVHCRTLREVGMPVSADQTDASTGPRTDPITHLPWPDRPKFDAGWSAISQRVTYWREFQATLAPDQFDVWYVGRRSLPGKAEMLWRDFLRSQFPDIAAYNRATGKNLSSFSECFAPYERIVNGRLWADVSGDERQLWQNFKATLDPRYRRPIDEQATWTQYADFMQHQFTGDLSKLNSQLGTHYAAFAGIRPPYTEEDLWEFRQDQSAWMGWFLTRNYREVIDYVAVRGRALWNTIIFVGAMVLCALTINPLAAYALSRFRLSYSNQILLFLLATMAFPYEVTMIPNFLLLRSFPLWTWGFGVIVGMVAAALVVFHTRGKRRILAVPVGLGAAVLTGFYIMPLIAQQLGISLGPVSLLNTYAALILPRMASGFSIFLLKGFFDSLPEELFEAGRLDGASELRMFWQIAIPLSTPVFAVMALQTFTAVYGSYLWALVVCQSDRMWTLMVYIFQLQQWAPSYITMAATVLVSIPTLLVFVLAQNTIMRGIVIPAYK